MSDKSDDCSAPNVDRDDNLMCRDFARGLCDRQFCKYRHENDIRPLNFCHDFQNSICPRVNCKFIHCTAEEVDEYKTSGEMSNQILAEATRKNQFPGSPPVCNQFKKGLCRRSNCKFRHLSKEQEEQQILELIQNNIQRRQDPIAVTTLRRSGVNYEDYQDNGLPVTKRRFVTSDFVGRDVENRGRTAVFKGYFAGSPPPGVLNRSLMLEEENQMLLKEIAMLNKQVQDLTATNEFLLDQNATLRLSNKQQHGNAVNMPAVSLTSSNAQPQMIRTVTASVATVPVSLATVTTRNPVSGSPMSITCPTVSIASPAQILAPSQQILVTTNPGQQLALTTSNQQLTLTNPGQPQQLALAGNPQTHQLTNQQLTSQAQQLALANTTQQLTSQAQQLALAANTTQCQAQQLALAATAPQHLTVPAQQLIAAQQNLAASTQQQIELQHRTNQITAINTSQAIAMSNATQPMVSYMTQQNLSHQLAH